MTYQCEECGKKADIVWERKHLCATCGLEKERQKHVRTKRP